MHVHCAHRQRRQVNGIQFLNKARNEITFCAEKRWCIRRQTEILIIIIHFWHYRRETAKRFVRVDGFSQFANLLVLLPISLLRCSIKLNGDACASANANDKRKSFRQCANTILTAHFLCNTIPKYIRLFFEIHGF